MTKKSRRARRNARRPRLSAAQMVRPGVDEAAVGAPAKEALPLSVTEPDLQSEYQYVISDLRRIGIIAAAMIGLLIGLALVLT